MDKKGLTAVGGIIIMVAIVIAIAGAVFWLVTSNTQPQTNLIIEGKVSTATQTGSITIGDEPSTIWTIKFSDGKTNLMLFRDSHNVTAPDTGKSYKFYYTLIEQDNKSYFDVYQIIEK